MKDLVRYCSRCGARLVDKAAVCAKCGRRVSYADFGTSKPVPAAANSGKKGRNIIVGIYGFSGALGIFCALVPAIGAIIIGVCFNLIYGGLIFIILGAIYLLIQRGLFGYAFLILGIGTAIFIIFYRNGLVGDLIAYIQKIKTFSF